MNLLPVILQAFALSFLGSVPPGAVNLSLVQQGSSGSLRKALTWAALASLLELFHLVPALLLHFRFLDSPDVVEVARPFSALLLVFLGVYAWNRTGAKSGRPALSTKAFLLVNVFNFAAIPFWLGTLQWISPTPAQSVGFSMAATLGAFACLALYARFGILLSQNQNLTPALLQKSLAFTFWGLGLWQLFPVIQHLTISIQ